MRSKRRHRVGLLALFFVATALLGLAALAQAELSANGPLFVRFAGGLYPNTLPRSSRAPVAVRLGGTVRTFSGERPPALRRIEIALNRGGRLDTAHLPRCTVAQIQPASNRAALTACAPARVGTGTYRAQTLVPGQPLFPTEGHIVAFNALAGGRPAILAHVWGIHPVPASRTIVFHVHHRHGTFGIVLIGSLPEAANEYVTHLSLNLHRDFTYRGQRRSYLSANCSAPAGVNLASFPFARASMSFADGRTLSSTLTRSCHVER